jgi:hypothetical protein
MERAGMDFAFMGHAGFYGMVRDMVTLERDRWDSYGPELLEKSLHDLGHDVGAKFGDLSSLNNPTNYTYGFKTHDRILGLLQITGFTDKPRTAKIRYKLAQSPIRTNEIRASLSGTAAKALQEVQDEQIRALRKAQQWNDTNEIQRLLRRIKATGDQIEKMINDAAQPVTATSNSAGASLQFRWVTPQADTNSAFDVLNHRNPGVTTPATIK